MVTRGDDDNSTEAHTDSQLQQPPRRNHASDMCNNRGALTVNVCLKPACVTTPMNACSPPSSLAAISISADDDDAVVSLLALPAIALAARFTFTALPSAHTATMTMHQRHHDIVVQTVCRITRERL